MHRCSVLVSLASLYSKGMRNQMAHSAVALSTLGGPKILPGNFSIRLLNLPKVLQKKTVKCCYAYFSSKSTNSESVSCWKCGEEVDLNKVLFCKSCEVVQKPRNADYFEILGMEKKFVLDTKTLTKNFRLLQMQLHPDRFSQRPEDEKTISATYSSLLNQAYKTLNSQLERGLYLLEIQGHPLEDGDTVAFEQDFLDTIMEINEEILEVQNQSDLERLKERNQLVLQDLFKKTALEFERNNLKAARECLARLKYYCKIEETINNLQQEFN